MSVRKAAARAAFLFVMAAPAAAQSGWAEVGQGTISGASGRAAIAAHSDPRYRELMLCTEGQAILITDINVRYSDDRVQNFRSRARIAAGGCSRMLSLSARGRAIASVDIGYDAASLGAGTVRIQLFVR